MTGTRRYFDFFCLEDAIFKKSTNSSSSFSWRNFRCCRQLIGFVEWSSLGKKTRISCCSFCLLIFRVPPRHIRSFFHCPPLFSTLLSSSSSSSSSSRASSSTRSNHNRPFRSVGREESVWIGPSIFAPSRTLVFTLVFRLPHFAPLFTFLTLRRCRRIIWPSRSFIQILFPAASGLPPPSLLLRH